MGVIILVQTGICIGVFLGMVGNANFIDSVGVDDILKLQNISVVDGINTNIYN